MNGAAAWADAVQALTLFAADPVRLGGLAVRAGAGPVRDHFLTLLRNLLPSGMPVVRLPLHARDDRLLGGLDLAATLGAGRPILQKGLLAEANDGVVVLAMAERIEPGTAARLCAALDDGVVTLQRDGLSRVLSARFGIVALDEGVEPDEQPPASLLDRMAFRVDLTEVSLRDVDDGARDLFGCRGFQDLDGAGRPPLTSPAFASRAADEQAELYRDMLIEPDPGTVDVAIDPIDEVEALSRAAMALGIDSLRACLLALRAVHVAAALSGREYVTDVDLGLAARLVLAPRATRFPPPEESQAPSDTEPPPQSEDMPASDQERLPDQPLEDVVLDAAKAALPPDLLARLALANDGRGLVRTPGRAGQFKMSNKRGRPIGTRQGDPKGGARLHLLETLKAAAPWQMVRRQALGQSRKPGRFEVRRDDFRIVRFRQRIGTTTVFAVDASGSAAMHRLGEAKGAVELLLADCYVRRDQVALLAFRGHGATLLLSPTGSLLRAKRSLAGLPGGGPTPLAAGIEAALTLANVIRRTGRTPVITLLTDARANVTRDGTAGRPIAEAEAMESARAVRASGVAALLVDTSPRPNPFARRLADEMRGQYVPLPYADASALSRAVRSAAME